ncbi:hybrid sensor histidine kinase/response regulator [Hyalangium versicolor]|uniref:hybrid sensor histidine kinase/response regulator n=1 Tax=Hyalangium versicolor TaxID=2861190 RepID=UPI001CCA9A53|nr:ATP-binding protein [Hyalangium versicolor]
MNRNGRLQGTELTQALHALETSPSASEELRHLARELQRHQLELEMQNHELQEAQQALEESRNRYMELYDFAPMACVSLNARACIQDLNLTGATLLNRDRRSLHGLPFTPFVDPTDVSRFLLHVRRCIAGETLSMELRLRIDGSQIDVRLHSAPVVDQEPNKLLCRTAIIDITELRKMQARLSMAERMATVGRLAAGIAHEINNPLAFLMGNLTLATCALEDQTRGAEDRAPHDPPEQALQSLADAQVGAERILDIMKNLGAFARPPHSQPTRVDVQEELELATKMAMLELRYRAQIVRDYAKVPEVIVDRARLGQVFLNLLVNAAQSIPEGAVHRNELRLTLRTEEPFVIVKIQDTGEGMPESVIEHIFEPFFTTKESGHSMGLGLAISHSIMEQLGGSITAESTPGQGSTFTLRLPITGPTQERPASRPYPHEGPKGETPRGRILIVDDEIRFGQTLVLLLGRSHDVTYTPSADEALHWIQQGRHYDAIICDLMMAEVTGKQFHDALREQAPGLAHRVIFMTGGAYTPASLAFVAKMSNPLLTKPFKTEELEKLLMPLILSV